MIDIEKKIEIESLLKNKKKKNQNQKKEIKKIK